MLNRRDFLKTVGNATTGMYVMGRGGADVTFAAIQDRPDRRQVIVGGRRIRVIDMHAHCVIPVAEIVKGTPLADSGSGGRNNILGPQRLELMDQRRRYSSTQ